MEKSERGGIEPSATTGESTSVTSTESDTDGGFSRRTFLDAAAALTLPPQTASAATPSVEQVVEDRSVADDGTYALTDCGSVPGNLNDIRVQAKMNDGPLEVKYLGVKWFENSRQLLAGIARSQVRWTVSNAHHGNLRFPYDPSHPACFLCRPGG